MNPPLTTRILLGQTKVNLPAMVDIAELYYQAAGRKAEKEREREPFDCITRCINIFGFWQRQLNKLSYHHHPLLELASPETTVIPVWKTAVCKWGVCKWSILKHPIFNVLNFRGWIKCIFYRIY